MAKYRYPKQHKSNYNYKTKRSFGQRIKNFFTIPEEDLKEEPSKKFEKIKLFRLNQGIIFLSILVFMFIINILVGFNINFLYLRQILGFLFIILIPGLLIILCFKIRTVKFWEYLVYTVGLSIAFIMFAGLAVNWTLPALGITDKPLSLWPILICFNIFLLALWFVALYRNKDLKPFDVTIPKLDAINRIFFIIPLIFPLLSVLGAFLLNNHGPNILTMIMLGGIAIYVLFLVIFRKKMNENVWPWALWMIGLALLLSGWMRSWFVSGSDISLEYWVFQMTKNNSIWELSNFNNAYNAMLSINILPTILSNFVPINNQFIFKFFIPILFSLITIIVYTLSKRILPNLPSFFSGLLFLSMPDFINWSSIPIRQEVALIFFGIMILLLFTKDIPGVTRKILLSIFGASMIVSHYSTSYIALLLFILVYIFNLIFKLSETQKIKKGELPFSERFEFYLTGALILFLLIFGFLWYFQVTHTGDGLVKFSRESLSNFGNLFSEDTRPKEATDPILGIFNKLNLEKVIKDYKNESLQYSISNTSEGFSEDRFYNYNIRYVPSEILDPNISSINILSFNHYLKQILSKIFQFFILIGLIYLIFQNNMDLDIKNIFIVSGFIVFIFLFLPLFTVYYNITRFIQQILIILAPISILGGRIFFAKLRINYILGLSLLLIFFILVFSGFVSQICGGDIAKVQLNNLGWDYNANYMLTQDYFGANWINNEKKNFRVYAEGIANLKLNSYGGELNEDNINRNVIPHRISKKDYVYLSYINNIKEMGVFSMNGVKVSYNFPKIFLNENKDKIYCNGGSQIFK